MRIWFLIGLLASGLGFAGPARATDIRAEVEAILALDKAWVEAIADKNVAWIANLYGGDKARFMPPGSPAAIGREAIGEAWTGLMATPGFRLTFSPESIHVAGSGDHAHDIGSYELHVGVGDEATVKRLRLRRGRAELQPENPAFETIVPDPRELRLLGKVIEHTDTAAMFVTPQHQETADYIEGRYG